MNEQTLIQQRQRQLAQVYDPQERFIQEQISSLPGQFAGQRSALEQARVNAFRDIGNIAQRRGMFFSGFQPAEQARYLGERYLPGLQDIEARQEQGRLGLLEQLIGLRSQRAGTMADFQEQLRQERLQRQAQTQRVATGGGTARTSGTTQMAQPKQWGAAEVKAENAGLAFTDPGGLPVSAAMYAFNNNLPLETVLANDPSSYGQQARDILTGRNTPAPLSDNANYQTRLNYVRQRFPLLF